MSRVDPHSRHLQQPIVHAANFHDRHEPAFGHGPLGEILEKRPNLLPSRADLPPEHRLAVFSAKIYGKLSFVLVDTVEARLKTPVPFSFIADPADPIGFPTL